MAAISNRYGYVAATLAPANGSPHESRCRRCTLRFEYSRLMCRRFLVLIDWHPLLHLYLVLSIGCEEYKSSMGSVRLIIAIRKFTHYWIKYSGIYP